MLVQPGTQLCATAVSAAKATTSDEASEIFILLEVLQSFAPRELWKDAGLRELK